MNTKIYIIIAAAMGMAVAAEAQTVSFGPRVGATFAKINLSGEDADAFNKEINSNAGLQAGAVAQVRLNDMFSLQPELLYVQKGLEVGEGGEFIKQRYDYLEMPVLAKVSFGTEQVQGFVTAGPSVGYWLSAKSKYKISGQEETEDYEFVDEDNRTELGANFGVGMAYKAGAGFMNVDVRYGLGLTSITNAPDDTSKVRNRVLGVSVAYLFSL